ncbi:MAG: SDR family oxidoreductase [Gammaproteobacteria bacterium]|jgi:NAD(P)-dependent dehydrogenase (short-subunit alcohol dehydrogenase family)|nr:SDR family oxidoreductase [Gammaproteobacteria bacterium]
MFSLAGKVAFITGGTAGIGLAAARRLIKAGASVAIVGRRAEGERIAAEIGARFYRADVTAEETVVAALDAARRELGPIDVLFNNAGIENTGPTIEESGAEEFQRLMDVDLKAPYVVLHHAASRMRDGGSIIISSSVAGFAQLPGYSQYSAAKAALVSLAKTAALELAPRGIRVNAICPSSVWSEMLPPDHPEVGLVKILCPQARVCEPEEVAALVHFLAADDCRYLSGAAIPIDGALLAGYGYPLLSKLMS